MRSLLPFSIPWLLGTGRSYVALDTLGKRLGVSWLLLTHPALFRLAYLSFVFIPLEGQPNSCARKT